MNNLNYTNNNNSHNNKNITLSINNGHHTDTLYSQYLVSQKQPISSSLLSIIYKSLSYHCDNPTEKHTIGILKDNNHNNNHDNTHQNNNNNTDSSTSSSSFTPISFSTSRTNRYKGTNGRIVALGGNSSMSGAPVYVVTAASTLGIDSIQIISSPQARHSIGAITPNVMVAPLLPSLHDMINEYRMYLVCHNSNINNANIRLSPLQTPLLPSSSTNPIIYDPKMILSAIKTWKDSVGQNIPVIHSIIPSNHSIHTNSYHNSEENTNELIQPPSQPVTFIQDILSNISDDSSSSFPSSSSLISLSPLIYLTHYISMASSRLHQQINLSRTELTLSIGSGLGDDCIRYIILSYLLYHCIDYPKIPVVLDAQAVSGLLAWPKVWEYIQTRQMNNLNIDLVLSSSSTLSSSISTSLSFSYRNYILTPNRGELMTLMKIYDKNIQYTENNDKNGSHSDNQNCHDAHQNKNDTNKTAHVNNNNMDKYIGTIFRIDSHVTILILGNDALPQDSTSRDAVKISRYLHNVAIIVKGEVDIITNGHIIIYLEYPGTPRRAGGQGDILAGITATMALWTIKQSSEIYNTMINDDKLISILDDPLGHCFTPLLESSTTISLSTRYDIISLLTPPILSCIISTYIVKQSARKAFSLYGWSTEASQIITHIPSTIYDILSVYSDIDNKNKE